MLKNDLLFRRFAIGARRALLGAAKGETNAEEAAVRFFCRRIAFRFLEVNGYLPFRPKKNGAETAAGFAEICGILGEIFHLFAGGSEILFEPKLVPVEELSSSFFDLNREGEIGILGHLFQYFKTEERNEVSAAFLRENRKTDRKRIPAATQLFTPDWIIRYLVENCVGRYWGKGKPFRNLYGSRKSGGYLGDSAQIPEIETVLARIRREHEERAPDSIRLIDPCMGCGHILLTAFEAFLALYEFRGKNREDAVHSILTKNLYGYELDPAAADLARFLLMVKAREFVPDLFRLPPKLNLCSSADLPETSSFGSLVRSVPFLSEKFDITVTNPPYLGRRKMSRELAAFLDREYPAGKPDIFAAFMIRCTEMTRSDGLTAMITPQSWMFLSSFEPVRRRIYDSTLISLLHLGTGTFKSLSGEVTQTAAFLILPRRIEGYRTRIFHLTDGKSDEKERAFLSRSGEYLVCLDDFRSIPGIPIPYLLGSCASRLFLTGHRLCETADLCQGMATTDNNRFLRRWYETDYTECAFGCRSREEAAVSGKRWFPYNKGGDFRRWYGNQEYLINWESDGALLRALEDENGKKRAVFRNQNRYFQEGLTWSKISGGNLAVRYTPPGFLFDVAGCSIFHTERSDMLCDLGFLNSAAAQTILSAVSPTLNYEVGHLGGLPRLPAGEYCSEIERIVSENIELSRADWNAFETSWEFLRHPLLGGKGIAAAFGNWEETCEFRFRQMKENEERLNRIFLDLYGLGDSDPAVSERLVTVRRADRKRDVRSFLSYVVGIFAGRYGVEKEGIFFAGGSWRDAPKSRIFPPAEGTIIPIGKEENGIPALLDRFIQTVFPGTPLAENLRFIQNGLGESGVDPHETIRRYFEKEFSIDHAKIYKKKPIYKVLPGRGIQYIWRVKGE